MTPLALTPQQIAQFPRFPPVVHQLYAIDPEDGWPPKLARAVAPRTLTPLRPLTVLDRSRESRLRRRALHDPRIQALLGGRWEYLGCHQTDQRSYRHDGALHTRLSFYNYTARYAIDVDLVNDDIVEVARRDDYMPPEGPSEMAQAIAMARADAIAWPFHTGEIDFRPQHNPDGGDVVFWFVSHLKHVPEDGADPWHAAGPTLLVEPAIPSEPQAKEVLRTVAVAIEIAVKRSAALAADTERTFSSMHIALLDRDHGRAEIAYQTDPIGTAARAAVLATLTWNADGSIGVDCSATLYLRTDSADTETHHVNVLRDRSEELNLHLASGGLVPDRAHIRVTLTNRQRCALAVLPRQP